MAASPDWSNFHIEALRDLVAALGIIVPGDATKEQLVTQINLAAKKMSKQDFDAAVAKANAVVNPAPNPVANTAPLAGPTPVEVTFPRRNLDAGLTSYSIKSDTFAPRAAAYHESAAHVPTEP